MHPENPYNWRRNVVYPEMGFDEFIARKDFEGYQKTIWNRISDKGNYDKILDVIKEHDEPLFIFNITMQNHGWYDINLFPPKQRAKVDKQYENYKPLQAYETLLVQSDEALRSLVGRLKKMRRPVVLCFFGDHQPPMRKDIVDAISQQGRSAWDTELSLTQKTFAVPYFIWSNVKHRSFSDDTIMNERGTIASTNYLGALTLMYADLPLTEYDAFLINMRRTVQAINEYGAMNADQEWHFISDDLKDRALLNDYENLQYYMMMDRARQ